MTESEHPSSETLVAYWAGDLGDEATEQLDLHLFGCASCSATSGRLASLVQGLRDLLPPVIDRKTVERLRAQGLRVQENAFSPEERTTVTFPADADLLVHRLTGFDLSSAARVHLTVRSESSGKVLVESFEAPFDPAEGVLIACQQHFRYLPADPVFEVRATSSSGVERVAVYAIPHVW